MTEEEKKEAEDKVCKRCPVYPLCELDVEKCWLTGGKREYDKR